jgi:outer membrane lipoprotein
MCQAGASPGATPTRPSMVRKPFRGLERQIQRREKKMGVSNAIIRSLALLALFLASGCAHVISSEVRQSVKEDLAFPAVLQDPDSFRGEMVIWGGVIVETENRREGTSLILLETPLDSQGFPEDAEHSRGRFIARTRAYLDPEVYRKGRKVTMAGEVVGKELRGLGEMEYAYPVLSVRELHLWKEEAGVYGWPYGPYYWGPPLWYWDWWWYPHWHYYYLRRR